MVGTAGGGHRGDRLRGDGGVLAMAAAQRRLDEIGKPNVGDLQHRGSIMG